MFAFLVIVGSIIISTSGINTFIHVIVKEFHNTAGALIIATCASILISRIFQQITNIFQYLYPVHHNAWVCTISKYRVILFLFMYHIAKVAYLTHFSYLMCSSYKMVSTIRSERVLQCNYTGAILTASIVCAGLLISIDQANDKSSLATTADEFCAGFFNKFAATRIFLLLIIGFATLLQVIIFVVAMTFYFLVTKRCCGKGPSDAHVSMTLISTIGLSTIQLISLLLAGVKSESTVTTASIATSVEQVILLFIFVTHKKARKKLMTILKCKRQSRIPVRYPRPSVSSETIL